VALPLYQGFCLWQYNSANADYLKGSNAHAKWTKREEVGTGLPDTQYLMRLDIAANAQEGSVLPRLGYRAVQNATNERTWICTLLPGCPAGNSIGTATTGSLLRDIQLLASLTSLVADQALRPRMSQANLNWFVVEEVPVLPPSKSAILAPLAALLSFPLTAQSADLVAFADATGSDITPEKIARTSHERLRLRSMIDAVVAHLYGMIGTQFAYILRDCDHPVEQVTNKAFARNLDPKGFWRVDKNLDPELRHTVLAQVAFADLKALIGTHREEEGLRRFLGTGPDDGWMLPETLCLADYNLGHDERAKRAQSVASRLGPRFYDWQLKKTPEESWEECRRHAAKIRAIRSIGLPESNGTGSTEGGAQASSHGTGSTASPSRSATKPTTGSLFDPDHPTLIE